MVHISVRVPGDEEGRGGREGGKERGTKKGRQGRRTKREVGCRVSS